MPLGEEKKENRIHNYTICKYKFNRIITLFGLMANWCSSQNHNVFFKNNFTSPERFWKYDCF